MLQKVEKAKQISLQINGLNIKRAKGRNKKAKQISLQINGLNVKLVNGEKEDERKTGFFADQWFKLETKHQTMARSIKKKLRKWQ